MQIIEQESKLNAERKYFFWKLSNHKNTLLNFYEKGKINWVFFGKKQIFFVKLDLWVIILDLNWIFFSILLQRRLYLWEVVLVYLFRIALPLTRQIIKSMGNAFLYVFHYFNWLALVHIIHTSISEVF